jgi:hypothetical protein
VGLLLSPKLGSPNIFHKIFINALLEIHSGLNWYKIKMVCGKDQWFKDYSGLYWVKWQEDLEEEQRLAWRGSKLKFIYFLIILQYLHCTIGNWKKTISIDADWSTKPLSLKSVPKYPQDPLKLFLKNGHCFNGWSNLVTNNTYNIPLKQSLQN